MTDLEAFLAETGQVLNEHGCLVADTKVDGTCECPCHDDEADHALERVATVIAASRHETRYSEYAIAALVLDALRWPRSDGTVPDA